MPNRILIVGASGLIGNTLYRELLPYFNVFGTYATQESLYAHNRVFFKFKAEEDNLEAILKEVRPKFIISTFKGEAKAQLKAHESICNYLLENKSKILYISCASVFDAKGDFPSYEEDPVLAQSDQGKLASAIEKLLKNLPENKRVIIRLPLVLGINAPLIIQLKQAIKHHATFEVFPNLIVSATTQNKLAQQIHYIINKNLKGIFHLASEDVIHHDELFDEIAKKISRKKPIFKNVFSSNDDRFLAILPKENLLPKNYQITIEQVIEESTLKDEIETLKTF
ncbi:MAG: sugar nucleotide-binding protein [Flavobacteriaceae bacterium]|nr:sugar nucleotide-binding protein [Flavobacteriaceae bacterium]